MAGLRVGDVVSVYRDCICDRLDPAAAAELQRTTALPLAATNV